MSERFPRELVDARGPTASQAAGLTLAAARAVAGGVPLEIGGVLVGAVGVSGGSATEDQQIADAAVRALA